VAVITTVSLLGKLGELLADLEPAVSASSPIGNDGLAWDAGDDLGAVDALCPAWCDGERGDGEHAGNDDDGGLRGSLHDQFSNMVVAAFATATA
jgi:hypothetical protein